MIGEGVRVRIYKVHKYRCQPRNRDESDHVTACQTEYLLDLTSCSIRYASTKVQKRDMDFKGLLHPRFLQQVSSVTKLLPLRRVGRVSSSPAPLVSRPQSS